MKKFLVGLLLALFCLIPLGTARAQTAQNFKITSFSADYYVGRTSERVPTLKVEETIVAQFPNYNQNHGIERAIPLEYKDQPIDLQIQNITGPDGSPISYTTRKSNGNLVVRIGDADKYVRGEQTYKLIYSLKNQISFYDNHQEFYWDVNGTAWQQNFGSVIARIHIPRQIADQLQDNQLCYSGLAGSKSQACNIVRSTANNEETQIVVSARNLSAGENLSFVIGFNSGTFAVDKAAAKARQIRVLSAVSLAVALPLMTLIWLVTKWRKFGRDPSGRGTIVPEYTPPKDLSPLECDVLLRESFHSSAVSALIIDMAIRKILLIRAVESKKLIGSKTEYSIEALKQPDSLTAEEKTVYSMIFGSLTVAEAKTVNLKDVSKKAYMSIRLLATDVPQRLTNRGYFVKNPVKTARAYYGLGGALLTAGFAGSFIAGRFSIVLLGLTIGLALSGIITLAMAKLMPARSLQGVTARDYLLGLKMYIALAEADRLKYLQSPAGVKQWGDTTKPENMVKLFEKLLPYAMIFGLEKEWAKEFKDIYTQPPDWYQGNMNNFNTVFLVSSLNSFGSVASTSFAPPSSSSSSGFGGGGFSGGGGGGGGGGGW
ncbi:MAG: DUF2207 domain-containing protein [Candidatus Saccharimonadales bacterium]